MTSRGVGQAGDLFGSPDWLSKIISGALRSVVCDAEIDHAVGIEPAHLTAWGLSMQALPMVLAADPAIHATALELLEQAMANRPTASDGNTVVILSPHQNNFEMPVRVEVWNARPNDDRDDWQQVSEYPLRVGPNASLYYDSPPGTDFAAAFRQASRLAEFKIGSLMDNSP